jgi:hypothetical protein
MPACSWGVQVDVALAAIGARLGADASGLASWARFSVDHLYYLADLDALRTRGANPRGHTPQTIDYAHGGWAAGTAITAIDRCAAALGAGLLPHRVARTYDHRELSQGPTAAALAAQSLEATAWVNSVAADPETGILLAFRKPLVHAYVAATGQVSTGPITARNALEATVGGQPARIQVDDLVARCCAFAHRHVADFLQRALVPGF